MSSIFTSTSVFYNLTLSYVISNCRSLIFIFIWCFSFIFVSFFAYCSLNSTNFFFTKIAIAFFILVNSLFGNLFSFLSYITAISIALFLHNIFYFPTLFWCPLFYFSLIFFFLEKLLIFPSNITFYSLHCRNFSNSNSIIPKVHTSIPAYQAICPWNIIFHQWWTQKLELEENPQKHLQWFR